MSQLNVNTIKNRTGTSGPVLTGLSTVSGSLVVSNDATVSGAATVSGNLSVTGNVSVGGTLTYEDVTNVDSVGLVTARTGVRVLAGNSLLLQNVAGNAEGSIECDGAGTNTDIRIRTNSTERLRVTHAGLVGIGTNAPESALHVTGTIPNAPTKQGVHIGAHSGYGIMQFTAATGGIIDFGESGVDSVGRIIYTHSNDALAFQTGNSEALRIDSSGRLLIGETSAVLDTSNALLQMGASEGANMVLYRDDSSVAQNDSIGLIRFYLPLARFSTCQIVFAVVLPIFGILFSQWAFLRHNL